MLANTTIASPLTTDQDGVVRIGKTRVTLDTVIHAFNRGGVPEEIALQYPALSLADIYATVAYYLQNRPEVDGYLAERDYEADEIRRANEVPGIRERLLLRRKQTDDR